MWRDFFNFSKRERATILALTIFILTAQLLIWTKDTWVHFMPIGIEHRYQQKKALESFRDSVSNRKFTRSYRTNYDHAKFKKVPIRLAPFNPNTADSLTLRSLGLRSYVVKNILNYRRKGGRFRNVSDLSKIYGMDESTFSTLEPLITLTDPSLGDVRTRQGRSEKVVRSEAGPEVNAIKTSLDVSAEAKPTAIQMYELNDADTSLLQQLKGVGSFTANRITRYRNQLGGFYSMAQLSEIKGLYPETIARLQSLLKIDPSRIKTLNVNKVSLEKLRAHPYLNFYQAKAIVELRKARGSLHSIDELAAFNEFKPEDLERLKWYLQF